MQNLQEAKTGLNKMFIAQVGMVACVILAVIPLVNLIAALGALVFLILSIVGLWQAGKDIEGCKTAFILTIIELVVSLLSSVFSQVAFLGKFFSLANIVLNLAVLYFVCTSVSEVMTKIGSADAAKLGHTTWLVNLACALVSAAIIILAWIPFLGTVIAGIGSVLTVIASLVGGVLYIMFLYKSSQAL